ncbi:MAG: heparinase II/III-family protein [Chlorobiaceae bacterium]
MSRFFINIRTALALGISNILRSLLYRKGVTIGFNPVRRLKASISKGPFFKIVTSKEFEIQAATGWQESVKLFGHWNYPVHSDPPDWFESPFTGKRIVCADQKWWKIQDVDPVVGDIKLIWELSRMDWVLALAERARNRDNKSLLQLNQWLEDWCFKNPPYYGPNWKCGQEASIRVMHLAVAALILKQTTYPAPGLVDLITLHLQRIAPTISYSIAQDNNHGTSEAAALFIGGSWLATQGSQAGEQWKEKGRKLLENRVIRLIDADGSFSQYSVNYHRMMLDTLSIVEVWRRQFDLPAFSDLFQIRAKASARWLATMVDSWSGDAPNLGANDGAFLLPLTDADYRDFRPSVQLAMALFTGERAYLDSGQWNEQLAWLGVSMPQRISAIYGSKVFDGGGYAVLRRGKAMAMLRYPRFNFRPSQADALHLDLWYEGMNLLRDAGSYSYNTTEEWINYFPGTVSHNTVQFDDRNQMPRLSRFLYGDWLRTEAIDLLVESEEETTFGASYHDRHGAKHHRVVKLMDNLINVHDEVSGFRHKAILRWRVRPGHWILEGQTLTDGKDFLSFKSSVIPSRVELVNGWESRYYFHKTETPVLEIEINKPGTLSTKYVWC